MVECVNLICKNELLEYRLVKVRKLRNSKYRFCGTCLQFKHNLSWLCSGCGTRMDNTQHGLTSIFCTNECRKENKLKSLRKPKYCRVCKISLEKGRLCILCKTELQRKLNSRKCEGCGKILISKQFFFCSQKCNSRINRLRRLGEIKTTQRYCIVCNKATHGLFCSWKCQVITNIY